MPDYSQYWTRDVDEDPWYVPPEETSGATFDRFMDTALYGAPQQNNYTPYNMPGSALPVVVNKPDFTTPAPIGGETGGLPPFPNETPPPGYHYEVNQDMFGDYVWSPVPNKGAFDVDRGGGAAQVFPLPEGFPAQYVDQVTGETKMWNPQTGGYETTGRAGAVQTPEEKHKQDIEELYRQQTFGLQQQTLDWNKQYGQMQLEAQKQERLATLRANPASWLEYAATANEQPAIQPWMVPLMGQEYAGYVAGQPMPGWSTNQGITMADLPRLTNPSAQYMARLAPSAQQQYYGYQKARTRATPEDTQWMQWNTAPPGNRVNQLNYAR